MMRGAGLMVPMILLAGCGSGGGGGRDRIADKVEDNAENRAEAMDAAADTMTNALGANAVEQQANLVRAEGKDRADAIRNSQLDASALTSEQKNAIVAGKTVGTATPARR